MGMDQEYIIDTGSVESAADDVTKTAADYLITLDEITDIVDGLAANWEGETYETYRNGYYSNLDKLKELRESLVSLAGDLYDNVETAKSIVNQAKAIMK